MEYYTFSQGFTENDEERASGKHHVKNTWVKERYESDEEDGSREEEVNKMTIKEEDNEDTEGMVISSSTMLTSKVKYLNYGALKHDTPPAASSGGGRVLPPPSNKYHRGHPKYYRCRG
ncbi:unnamed protein product [Eruca vesicaria subsp. sativa]|uniref:Uncharacterized protein n=1 Tax=Eruca vesicaria subsp. sativa TaxID=29727 RepID=A0ABC8J3V1_ERUVS|nr:unnamed protein product [Eruca vesicaria subsp. sativa]